MAVWSARLLRSRPSIRWTSLPALKAPVPGLYGGPDSGISLTRISQMKDALTEAGKPGNAPACSSAFVVYSATPHAFHADYRPSYRKVAAEEGFQRTLDFQDLWRCLIEHTQLPCAETDPAVLFSGACQAG